MYKITTTNKTFEQLVKANNFAYKYISNSYKPQTTKQGEVTIGLWHPNKITTNQEFLDYCKVNKARPATFNEALQLALDNPDLQKEFSLVTYDGEQLCYLYLSSDGDERELSVSKSHPGSSWRDTVRFLVVPAPVPAVSLDSGSLGSSGPLELGDGEPEHNSTKLGDISSKLVDQPQEYSWQDRLNWLINGHLSLGKNDEEYLTEQDQLELREALKEFITGLLAAKDQEINDSVNWERDQDKLIEEARIAGAMECISLIPEPTPVTQEDTENGWREHYEGYNEATRDIKQLLQSHLGLEKKG